MIRRNPTMIPMTDSDVQDVRDVIAQAKVEEGAKQHLLSKMTNLSKTSGITKEDREVQKLVEYWDEQKKAEAEKTGL